MITAVDKKRILQYLAKHALGNLYYADFKEFINFKKCSDLDLCNYFISNCEEFLLNQKGSFKLFLKYLELVGIFIQVFLKEKMDIPKCDLERVLLLEEKLEHSSIEDKQVIGEILKEMHDYIHEHFADILSKVEPVQVREEKNSLEEQTKQINDQEKVIASKDKKIEEQKKKLESLRKEKKKLEAQYQKLEELCQELKQLLEQYKEEKDDNTTLIRTNEEKILELDEKLEMLMDMKINLEHQKRVLERSLAEAQSELTKVSASLEESEQKNQDLRTELENMSSKVQVLKFQLYVEKRNEKIEEIVLKSLYEGKYSLVELCQILAASSYLSNSKEVYEVIKTLGQNFSIATSMYPDGPKYFIPQPMVSHNATYDFFLDKDKKVLNLLFVSDFHLSDSILWKGLEIFDAILAYCVKNQINQVFHLGDFFDFTEISRTYDYDKLKKASQLIETLTQKIPSDLKIKHFVIGGNHDEYHLKLGKDLLAYFTSEREDFTLMGYQNTTLNIIQENNNIAHFLLRHPYKEVDKSHFEDQIKTFNRNANSIPDFTFLGHSHCSYLDLSAKRCIVPSLTRDRICHGAWHICLHFEDNTIEDMHFIPLIFDKKFIPTSDIVYHTRVRRK